MKIEETFVVAAPRQRVWDFITDPRQVGPCLPGCQGIEITGERTYKAAIKVAVGPIKTTFNVDVEWTEEDAPHFAASVTRGEEGGRASSVTAHNVLRLKAIDEAETEVFYSSDVSVVGRLGKFGLGIMKKKAKKLGGEFAQAFKARVEGGTATVEEDTAEARSWISRTAAKLHIGGRKP